MSGNGDAVKLRPVEAGVSISECRARLPFRFGMNTMKAAPLATCRVLVEFECGERGEGYSSDLLVPKWFEKNPDAPISEDWANLVASQRAALDALLDRDHARLDSAFEHWRRVYGDRVESYERDATDVLVRVEGVSLVERAMIDAVCRRVGTGLLGVLRGGLLGFDAGRLDPDAVGWSPARLPEPLRETTVRHTVGLVDALEPEDVTEPRACDGLPECLVEDIRAYGLTHFKIKIVSAGEGQLDRLARIWDVVRREAGPDARVTLDGNEQFESIEQFAQVTERITREDRFDGLADALILIEQPLPRSRTFDAGACTGLDDLPVRCIIDEADLGLWALPEAAELGYGGASIKNCKGVFSAVLNRARCDLSDGRLMQSGEDLTNLPIIALQQDLATMATLGVTHVERNGHHYFKGLGHLPRSEREAVLSAHADLYEGDADEASVRIEGGRVSLASVVDAPGFGYAGPVDLSARIPAEEWDPAALAE